MRKLTSLVLIFFSCGCASQISTETMDRNGDGITDMWIDKENTTVVKTGIDNNGDGAPERWLFWSTDGRLLKEVFEKKDHSKKQEIHYFKNAQQVVVNKETLIKNELDVERSYAKNVWPFVSKAYLYTKNNELRFSEVDTNQDGAIDKTLVIKNFRKIDEYSGAIK